MAAIRESLKRRIERLESVVNDDDEPLVIFLNCVTADSSECVMGVIAGNAQHKRAGETLHREPGETEDDFVERIHQRARDINGGIMEVELHGA